MSTAKLMKSKQMNKELEKYIGMRYKRWLDYASYHCSCSGIEDEASDVLQEVLCDLMNKSPEKLSMLLNKKSGQYAELDFFVLRMIKLNVISETSPYRHKYKSIPVDTNIDYNHLDIEDVTDEERDITVEILEKTNLVRQVLDELYISEHAKSVFRWRFFCGEKFSDWKGPESEKELFDCYYRVVNLIKERLQNKSLF
jgi:hypothetical protein